jgi:hypothetical protein
MTDNTVTCPTCGGSGNDPSCLGLDGAIPCPACNGTGVAPAPTEPTLRYDHNNEIAKTGGMEPTRYDTSGEINTVRGVGELGPVSTIQAPTTPAPEPEQLSPTLEQRVTELERQIKLLSEHIHEVEIGDSLSGPPLVEGESNEGQAIWRRM